jgi:PAP2 superfamily
VWVLALGVGGAVEHATKVVTDSGYPSGHTLGAVMVATALASTGRIGLLLGAAWIAAMGITQVAVGAHLPIDVIGGLALGSVIGAGWMRVGSHLEVVEVAEAEHAGEFVQRGAALGEELRIGQFGQADPIAVVASHPVAQARKAFGFGENHP